MPVHCTSKKVITLWYRLESEVLYNIYAIYIYELHQLFRVSSIKSTEVDTINLQSL
jgi:hypothetical protein